MVGCALGQLRARDLRSGHLSNGAWDVGLSAKTQGSPRRVGGNGSMPFHHGPAQAEGTAVPHTLSGTQLPLASTKDRGLVGDRTD